MNESATIVRFRDESDEHYRFCFEIVSGEVQVEFSYTLERAPVKDDIDNVTKLINTTSHASLSLIDKCYSSVSIGCYRERISFHNNGAEITIDRKHCLAALNAFLEWMKKPPKLNDDDDDNTDEIEL